MLMTVAFETMWDRPVSEVASALLAPAMDTLPVVTTGLGIEEQFGTANA
jgi:hypothetical protein